VDENLTADQRNRFLLSLYWAVLIGCEVPSDSPAIMAALPEWRGETELTIGLSRDPGDEFIHPTVVGVDGTGSIYVYDWGLEELSRFDETGSFLNIVAKEGEGPGEFRSPSGFGVESDSVWFSENHTDRIQWVAPDGEPLRIVHTGLTPGKLGVSSVIAIGFFDDGEPLIVSIEEVGVGSAPFSPPLLWRYMRSKGDGETLDTLYEHQTPGRTILLHGGRTHIGYPGPEEYPIVTYRPKEHRVLRIERPVPVSPDEALVTLELVEEDGRVVRNRTLRLDPVRISAEVRDSLWGRLVRSGTLGGRMPLDRATEKELKQVAAWPDFFPPVETYARGPKESLWLKRAGAELEGKGEWLVVDSMFSPVARVFLPPNVSQFGFHRDQPWATLTDESGVPFVARIRFPTTDVPRRE